MNDRPGQHTVRTLLYFPMIHTRADMGNLGEQIQRATIRKIGRQGWMHNTKAVEQMWTEIERTIENMKLHHREVRVYQDGLPVCARELEIVTELARKRSRNHLLLLRLNENGATIMGTESPELLREEYGLIKRQMASEERPQTEQAQLRRKAAGDSLLKRRNQFIAERINSTLRPGETGILFIGMLHSVAKLLDEDIRVLYPLHRPVDRGED